ncbi:YceI family protein [Lysobacter soyae]|uniref:YceI family protein n=1 Tax=Lysobacter soyae TaxID=2764185 RepID=A0ABX8WN05_9GAMM|nr:YceI family protein [Lysobacter sp. CJ11]QYR52798.1 YceI family protein [Lysobacter sp. CJ11]
MKHTLLKSTLIALSLFALNAGAVERTYTLDPGHTQVDFRWRHMGFSTPAAAIHVTDGVLKFDPDAPTRASVSLTMPINTIDTRVPDLDKHLMSADFFDAAKYPTASFKSTKVEREGNGNRYKIYGNLTIKGVTKPVVLDATLNHAGEHPMMKVPAVGFDATTQIKRSDFGIAAFVPAVSDNIDIRITTEALATAAAAKAK